jgi:hypothetical protein
MKFALKPPGFAEKINKISFFLQQATIATNLSVWPRQQKNSFFVYFWL